MKKTRLYKKRNRNTPTIFLTLKPNTKHIASANIDVADIDHNHIVSMPEGESGMNLLSTSMIRKPAIMKIDIKNIFALENVVLKII